MSTFTILDEPVTITNNNFIRKLSYSMQIEGHYLVGVPTE